MANLYQGPLLLSNDPPLDKGMGFFSSWVPAFDQISAMFGTWPSFKTLLAIFSQIFANFSAFCYNLAQFQAVLRKLRQVSHVGYFAIIFWGGHWPSLLTSFGISSHFHCGFYNFGQPTSCSKKIALDGLLDIGGVVLGQLEREKNWNARNQK